MEENINSQTLNNTISLPSPTENMGENSRSSENSPEIQKENSPKFSIDLISEKSISVLGFNLYFDDIIILALILFLMQEEKKDYILIGTLGLMFFDFSIDKIKSFEPLGKLLSNFT